MISRSPLRDKYLEGNADTLVFNDLEIPVMFRPVDQEIEMVRKRAGFIDYSANLMMVICGKDAFEFIQKLIVNDLRKIQPGNAIYTSLLNEDGKIVDDAIICWIEKDRFLYIGTPMLKEPVIQWLRKQEKAYEVFLVEMGLVFISVQGPKSRAILGKLADVADMPYMSLKETQIEDIPVTISRVGFTGELGYEIYANPLHGHELWNILEKTGKDDDMGPYGYLATCLLGCEKGYLWGPDFYANASPLELGLEWTVAYDKGEFIGKEALLQRKQNGLKNRLIAFEVVGSDIQAVENDRIMKDGKMVGAVTTATPGFSINKSCIGRGWVDIEYAKEDSELEIEHEGTVAKIRVSLKRDWYDPKNIKVRS